MSLALTERLRTFVAPEGATVVRPNTQYPGERPRDANGRFIHRIVNGTPTIKQLWKFAESFSSSLNDKNRVPSNLQGLLFEESLVVFDETRMKALSKAARLWNANIRRLNRRGLNRQRVEAYLPNPNGTGTIVDPNCLHRLAGDISHFVNRYFNNREYIPSESTFQHARNARGTVVNAKDVFNDLLALARRMPTTYIRERKSLRFETPPVAIVSGRNRTLRYNFGPFRIEFLPDCGRGFNEGSPIITPCTPRYAATGRQRAGIYFHPVISPEGTICSGEGKNACIKHYNNGRLFDVVDVLLSVLNSFSTNPYEILEAWTGVCDERFNPLTNEIVPMDAVIDIGQPIYICTSCRADVNELFGCARCSTAPSSVSRCRGCLPHCGDATCENTNCMEHMRQCRECRRRFCTVQPSFVATSSTGAVFNTDSQHFTLERYLSRCNECEQRRIDGLIPTSNAQPVSALSVHEMLSRLNSPPPIPFSGDEDNPDFDEDPDYDEDDEDDEDEDDDLEDEDEDN